MASHYRAVKRNSLSIEVVEQIEQLVLNQALQVGDPLPSERKLAQELQVSRQVLREAMRTLTQKGLVQVLPGRGAFVAQPTAGFLGDSLHAYLRVNPHLVRDFLETRLVIESQTAFIAAERAAPEKIMSIKAALDDLDANRGNPDRFIEADLAFHTELALATGNEVLSLLVVSLRGALRESIRYFAANPDIVAHSSLLHRQVYDAVASHQARAAENAMREHFRITLAQLDTDNPPVSP